METHNQPQINRTESRRNILTGVIIGLVLGLTFGWMQQNIVIGIGMGLPLGVAIGPCSQSPGEAGRGDFRL